MFREISDGMHCSSGCPQGVPSGSLSQMHFPSLLRVPHPRVHTFKYICTHEDSCIASDLKLKSMVLHHHVHACVLSPSTHSWSSSLSESVIQLFGIWKVCKTTVSCCPYPSCTWGSVSTPRGGWTEVLITWAQWPLVGHCPMGTLPGREDMERSGEALGVFSRSWAPGALLWGLGQRSPASWLGGPEARVNEEAVLLWKASLLEEEMTAQSQARNEYPLPSIGKLAQCLRLYNGQAASNSFIKHVFSDDDVSWTVFGSWGPRDEKMLPWSSPGPKDQRRRQRSH